MVLPEVEKRRRQAYSLEISRLSTQIGGEGTDFGLPESTQPRPTTVGAQRRSTVT